MQTLLCLCGEVLVGFDLTELEQWRLIKRIRDMEVFGRKKLPNRPAMFRVPFRFPFKLVLNSESF